MKINDTNRISQVQKYQKASGLSDKDSLQTASTFAQRDGVTISSEALGMAQKLQVEDPQHAERLAEVKQQLQDGTYHVEPDAVIRKMLQAYEE